MIIDQLISHGDRVTYRPHFVAGRPVPRCIQQAKAAAASLFDVETEELLETRKDALLTWRAPGKRAPGITLTRPSSVLQVEGRVNPPEGEADLALVMVMDAHAPAARRAACLLMGHPSRVVVGAGLGWVWTVDLSKV